MKLLRIFKGYRDLEAAHDKLALDFDDLANKSVSITDIAIRNGGMDISACGELAKITAIKFGKLLREKGGKNYLEMHFKTLEVPDERLILTLQWVKGKSPHELRIEAETKLAELTKKGSL